METNRQCLSTVGWQQAPHLLGSSDVIDLTEDGNGALNPHAYVRNNSDLRWANFSPNEPRSSFFAWRASANMPLGRSSSLT